jgi:acyl-coenzyme A synthetase/AMP-(fatty) acid ligase
MPLPLHDHPHSLRTWLRAAGSLSGSFFHGVGTTVALADLVDRSSLSVGSDRLFGASVLLAARDQGAAALALVELDGVARRLVLCPPDLPGQHVASIIGAAAVDVVVADRPLVDRGVPNGAELVECGLRMAPARTEPRDPYPTEWVLLTSGTTGAPKLVVHDLATLTAPFRTAAPPAGAVVWSTFYDIRRYGGLQILLRAILGGGSLVLSSAEEPTAVFLARAGRCGVTHVSGTPSHWRRALMSEAARRIVPRYVRLSGEIADQAILDRLHACYRSAAIGHAFASTEAGVAFEVNDGLAGFPAGLVDDPPGGVEIRIEDGSLRLRSTRMARRYLGVDPDDIGDADGFADTGDMVERHGDRYHFVGRKGGIINVGGSKVHPEEVEAVINGHPGVQLSIVKARRNPITGAIVVADVMAAGAELDIAALEAGILDLCRRMLPAHKVPAVIRFVSSLDIDTSGKLTRRNA